jgi:hypothetical protein
LNGYLSYVFNPQQTSLDLFIENQLICFFEGHPVSSIGILIF